VAPETKTAVLNIRIKPSVMATAKRLAEADHRTLAAYVELLILRDAETAEPPKKSKRP
jgi:hypothetical protein